MSLRSRIAAAGLVFVLGAGTLPLAGCQSQDDAATVTQVNSNAEDSTSTLTPLERGELRREILDSVQAGIDGWLATDAETMRLYFNDTVMTPFEREWEEYGTRGLVIVHVHEPVYFDVVELNKAGTQALVKYRYNDTSYLADSNGERAEDLEPLDENEIQFTVEKQEDGSWQAVRVIGVLR